MTELLPGVGWYAVIEPKSGSGNGDVADLRYASVIAWERIGGDSGPRLRAWINGVIPVASDRFHEEVTGWVLNGFERFTDDEVAERSLRWKTWNWS